MDVVFNQLVKLMLQKRTRMLRQRSRHSLPTLIRALGRYKGDSQVKRLARCVRRPNSDNQTKTFSSILWLRKKTCKVHQCYSLWLAIVSIGVATGCIQSFLSKFAGLPIDATQRITE
jgi:hypothetical protein